MVVRVGANKPGFIQPRTQVPYVRLSGPSSKSVESMQELPHCGPPRTLQYIVVVVADENDMCTLISRDAITLVCTKHAPSSLATSDVGCSQGLLPALAPIRMWRPGPTVLYTCATLPVETLKSGGMTLTSAKARIKMLRVLEGPPS